MNANLISKTIEMTTNEAKKAGKIGTPEFKELRAYQEVYAIILILPFPSLSTLSMKWMSILSSYHTFIH